MLLHGASLLRIWFRGQDCHHTHSTKVKNDTNHIVRLSGQSRGGLGFCGSRDGVRGPLFVWGLNFSPATNKEHLGFLIVMLTLMWGRGKRGWAAQKHQRSHNEVRRMEKMVESKMGRSPASPQTHQNMEQLLQNHF